MTHGHGCLRCWPLWNQIVACKLPRYCWYRESSPLSHGYGCHNQKPNGCVVVHMPRARLVTGHRMFTRRGFHRQLCSDCHHCHHPRVVIAGVMVTCSHHRWVHRGCSCRYRDRLPWRLDGIGIENKNNTTKYIILKTIILIMNLYIVVIHIAYFLRFICHCQPLWFANRMKRPWTARSKCPISGQASGESISVTLYHGQMINMCVCVGGD